MTTNYSWANLPDSAIRPLRMLGAALAQGWQDTTTHVPDADCDFTQGFTRGPLTMTVTWAGEGTFKTIIAVKLTTTSTTPTKVMLDQEVFDNQHPIVFEGRNQDFLEWVAEDMLSSFTPEPA